MTNQPIFQAYSSDYLYQPPSPTDEPLTVMRDWNVYRLTDSDGKVTDHLVGLSYLDGRVTTGIISSDHAKLRYTTESGRVYQLEGDPRHSSPGHYVFSRWLRVNGIAHQDNVTQSYVDAQNAAKVG